MSTPHTDIVRLTRLAQIQRRLLYVTAVDTAAQKTAARAAPHAAAAYSGICSLLIRTASGTQQWVPIHQVPHLSSVDTPSSPSSTLPHVNLPPPPPDMHNAQQHAAVQRHSSSSCWCSRQLVCVCLHVCAQAAGPSMSNSALLALLQLQAALLLMKLST